MNNLSDFNLILREEIYLEPEDYQRAKELSEARTWAAYINSLGLRGLERWLKENIGESYPCEPDLPISGLTSRSGIWSLESRSGDVKNMCTNGKN